MRLIFPRLLTVCVLGVALAAADALAQLPLDRLNAPPGFAIELFARVPGARSLAVAEEALASTWARAAIAWSPCSTPSATARPTKWSSSRRA